jgi:hypothetical protein
VELLRATRPWVLLLSIFGFVAAILMMVAAIAFWVGPAPPEFKAQVVAIALLMAFLYGITSIYLFRYSRRIAALLASGELAHLNQALHAQRLFWRLSGIMMATLLLLVVAMAVLTTLGKRRDRVGFDWPMRAKALPAPAAPPATLHRRASSPPALPEDTGLGSDRPRAVSAVRSQRPGAGAQGLGQRGKGASEESRWPDLDFQIAIVSRETLPNGANMAWFLGWTTPQCDALPFVWV